MAASRSGPQPNSATTSNLGKKTTSARRKLALVAGLIITAVAVWPTSFGQAFVGRNGLVVFTKGTRSGQNVYAHLYTMRQDGRHIRRLTSGSYLDEQAAWSPDGQWL